MPGNEVGDRVHNFFGQENLSQGQYHSQVVDGNWSGLSSNLWAGGQRAAGAPFISNLKNFNVQQLDSEQGHTSSSHLRHGLNLTQSLRPESGRNQPQTQQAAGNGYMQGHQVFQTRQNEANMLGVDTESDWHNMPNLPRGVSVLESQGSGLDLYKKNLTRTDAAESPVNFDFFGNQQQISGRHPGMMQSLARQQSGASDMQLLQQQAMISQIQELQRQQHIQQLEARQQSSVTPTSSISKQTVGNHSASLINGIPINEASNFMWQPEVMANNANWLQRGASPVMQGSSNGLMLSPEQGQALRLMGMVPNPGDQSLYGLPISSSRGTPNLYSHVQVDKSPMSQMAIPHQYSHVQGDKSPLPNISAGGGSFSAHQYAAFSDQTNTNDGTSASRHDIQEKSAFGPPPQGLNMENLQQVNSERRNVPMQEFQGRQQLVASSETSQDKMVVQVPPSQSVATLDPTEEKILFGSDDNLWDAFGRNTGFNMLDGADSFNGFPSIQSGSWSALMQSAVAETSTSDMGVQEEWSGLSFRNTERFPGNERPSTIDNSKQVPVWAENLQPSSNINSRPFLQPEDVNRPNANANFSGMPGFHQSGDSSHEQHDRLQTDSSQRSVPQFLERGKWLDCSPQHKGHAEGSHIYGNAATSPGVEINERSMSGSWNHQQTMSSCNSSAELFNRPNGWNLVKSGLPHSNASLKTHDSESSMQTHREKTSQEEMGQVPGMWVPDGTIVSVGVERMKSADSVRGCGEDSGIGGIAAVPNSGATWVNRQSNQQQPNNLDVWRDADSSGSYRGNEGPGKYRHHMERNTVVLESPKNEKGDGETQEIENSNRKDMSSDGIVSSPYHRGSSMRENVYFDGNDARSPKLPAQINQRPPVTRKFQYHPMGDVSVDVPIHQQTFGGMKGQDPNYTGQSKFGHSDGDHTEIEKGDLRSLDDAPKSKLPGHMTKTLTSFDRSVGNYAPNKASSPRVPEAEASDGSVAQTLRNQSSLSSQGFGLQLAPPTQRLPMASSHGSSETGEKGHMWLATSQALPSQESLHGELRNNISGSSGQVLDKSSQFSALGNVPQAFASSFPFSRSHAQNQNLANVSGPVASAQRASVTPTDRTASMNQINEYRERVQASEPEFPSAPEISQLSGTDQMHPGDHASQIVASEAGIASQPTYNCGASQHGAPLKVLHNVWTNVSSKQLASKILSRLQPNNDCEMSTVLKKPGDEDSEKDGNDLSGVGPSVYSNSSGGKEQLLKESSGQQMLLESADSAEEAVSALHGKEPAVKFMPDASHSSPAATSRDIEQFGRSLRPNNSFNQNFSLLPQVQSMKSAEIDSSNRDVKRFKVSDNMLDTQPTTSNHGHLSYGYNAMVKDLSGNHSSVPSDPTMLSFSTKPGNGHDTNATSQEVLGYAQSNAINVSSGNAVSSVRSEHSSISPQMAPSWFEQYGTFKNGNLLPMCDVRNKTPPKIMEQASIGQSQSDNLQVRSSIEQVNSLGDTSQFGNAQQSPAPVSVASEHVASQIMPPPAVEPGMVMRQKKRKSETSELVPWHKELAQGSERLPSISAAELDWARATNRLIEKVDDDPDVNEDVSPVVKSKRRLVLTTQLVQQLFSPPPAAVLSADVKLHHESVVYSVARLALGNSCSSVSSSGRDKLMHIGSRNILSEKLKSPEKIDQYMLKIMEDLVGRAKKLENEILRLDTRASLLDLRVECQDLERFSVINRFAKFHGRGQNDGAEASSSSDATANAQKSCPQKYVTALPMPRNLPDRHGRRSFHCTSTLLLVPYERP
ncbi:uncharacterized protein LOC129308067 isoform X2 [Prosopis cineraria]|uniref:uncharacterized protein LOC129308067 isoform X2 n=1 Tax=Prosopis cineraria TaxID=364024 RepID=UPI0024107169|nr:uncharacterized protein LOC129308067 isoform X2 [Prosopis cineraria]